MGVSIVFLEQTILTVLKNSDPMYIDTLIFKVIESMQKLELEGRVQECVTNLIIKDQIKVDKEGKISIVT